MKKIIFTFVLAILINLAFSQGYHRLIRTNTTWDEFNVVLPEFCYTNGNRVFFTNQDTVINGLTYRISKSQQIHQVNPGPFCPPFYLDTIAYNTFQLFREDTVARKVFLYSPENGGSDQLFYDFSLQVGDTLKSSYYLAIGDTLIVDSIGNWILNNGESRKVFFFNSNLPAYYIEGIGDIEGLFYPIQVGFTEFYGGIFCVKENSVGLYGINCVSLYVGQNEPDAEPVAVFPNPATDLLNVVIPQNSERAELRLMDLRGIQVSSQILDPGSNKVAVSDFIPAIYIYQVITNHRVYNGKLSIY